MIFVDSNVPMYLVGAPHANKDRARALLEHAIAGGERLVTSAEVLQEILHRYSAIRRLDAVQPAFEAIIGVVDDVYPVEVLDVERAKEILLSELGLTSRDALHVATMRRYEVDRVMTFDAGFDRFPGITRVS